MARKGRGVGLLVVAPLGLALAGYWAAVATVDLPVSRAEPAAVDGVDLKGAVHVHTTRSDGKGTVDEVLAAATRADLDFLVISDHNARPLDAFAEKGVLVVPGVELSTGSGHVLVVGATDVPTRELMNSDPLAAAKAAGGLPILAHPVNLRRPWKGEWAGFAGMETVSGDSLWREAVADPLGVLVPAALALPISSQVTTLTFVSRDEAAFAEWDARPGLLALCSHDAHGYGGYEAPFRAMRMHLRLDAPLPRDPEAASAAFVEALRRGDAYCALDALLDPRGFVLQVEGGEVVAALRYQEALSEDVKPRIRLLRDGAEVATGTLEARAPLRRGRWRAEVELTVPWVLGERTFLWLFTAGTQLP